MTRFNIRKKLTLSFYRWDLVDKDFLLKNLSMEENLGAQNNPNADFLAKQSFVMMNQKFGKFHFLMICIMAKNNVYSKTLDFDLYF